MIEKIYKKSYSLISEIYQVCLKYVDIFKMLTFVKIKQFSFFFLTSLLEYNCSTMVCQAIFKLGKISSGFMKLIRNTLLNWHRKVTNIKVGKRQNRQMLKVRGAVIKNSSAKY